MANVLIIDDAAFIRMSIKIMLEKNGHHVVGEAENGLAGVAKYKELMPDVVTMDITMPEMDGIDALKAIRSHNSKANVVMISAMGQENLVREAVLNGARNFIVKPFKEEHVIQTIEQIVSGRVAGF